MANVVKISEAASLGLHTMVLLAGEPGRRLATREIAGRLGASEAHLAKVLQRLARAGLVESTRGPRGGFILVENRGNATLLEVYEAVDGPLVETDCLLGSPACGGEGCILGGLLETANREVREYLANTRLSELTSVYGGSNDG